MAALFVFWSRRVVAEEIMDHVSVSINSLCAFRSFNMASAESRTYIGNTPASYGLVEFNDNGVHEFNIYCNNITGYNVHAYATDLEYEDGGGAGADRSIPYVLSNAFVGEGNESAWTAELTNGDPNAIISTTSSVIKSNNGLTSSTGDNFSVLYKAYVGGDIPSGSYTGIAVYTIIMNDIPEPGPVIPLMQDPDTIATCKASPDGTRMEAMDERDGKVYYITKLADGNCWMSQNLDLDLKVGVDNIIGTTNTRTREFVEFTKDNTNISGDTWTVSSPNVAYDTQTEQGVAWDAYGRNGENNLSYEVRSYDYGNHCLTGGTTDTTCSNAVGTANVERVGNYYNWPAATAGSGTYQTPANTHVNDSICPRGWILPYGGSVTGEYGGNTKGGYYYLMKTTYNANLTTVMQDPLNFPRSGRYNSGMSIVDRYATYGYFWTSTVYTSATIAYLFHFDTEYFYPGISAGNKGGGFQVRCVAL